jgi:hypothetical protein
MEGNKKVTNPELIRLRRIIELREYALAASYPLTHSGISAHHERAVDRLPVIAAHPLLGALGDNHHPTDIAAECREAAAQDAVTPQGYSNLYASTETSDLWMNRNPGRSLGTNDSWIERRADIWDGAEANSSCAMCPAVQTLLPG